MDPSEELYLRAHFNRSQFRRLQRQRLRAALDYVRRTKHNAAILLRLGEAARGDCKRDVVAAGQTVVNSALRLRINAVAATRILYLRIVLPEVHISIGYITNIYENFTGRAVRLVRLQNPTYSARVLETDNHRTDLPFVRRLLLLF